MKLKKKVILCAICCIAVFACFLSSCDQKCYLDQFALSSEETAIIEAAVGKSAVDITEEDLNQITEISVAGMTLKPKWDAVSFNETTYTILNTPQKYTAGYGNELSALRLFPNLERLFVLYAPGWTDGAFLAQMEKLQEIELIMTGLRDFTFLSEMPQITECSLVSCPVETVELPPNTTMNLSIKDGLLTDVSFLDALSSDCTFVAIMFNRVPITNGLDSLERLPNLTHLCIGAPGMDYAFLSKLSPLTILLIGGGDTADLSCLTHHKDSLTDVILCDLDGVDLTPLDELTNLQHLSMWNVQNPIRGEITQPGSKEMVDLPMKHNIFDWFIYDTKEK